MKKNKYTIHKNLEQLSSQDIQQFQDFDALLEQFNQAPAPEPSQEAVVKSLANRRPWIYGSAAAAALVGVLFYIGAIGTGTSNTGISQAAYFAAQEYVKPPMPQASTAFASYKVDAYEGGTYTYKSGTRLVIPPRAFNDRSGNIVQGKVDIKYKEYHDFVDFFLAGIPMEYDSAGTRYILESAGMMEIYAEQDGERVFMNPEEIIDIELISDIQFPNGKTPPSYNIYKLDEENRNWVYQAIDNIQVVETDEDETDALAILNSEETIEGAYQEELSTIQKNQDKKLAQLEARTPKPTTPQRPRRANGNNVSFDLDFLNTRQQTNVSEEHAAVSEAQKEVLALQRQYEGTIWEVLPNQPQFNESTAQVIWEDMELERTNNREYQLTLIGGTRKLAVKVLPVLLGEDYDKAITAFDVAMTSYNATLAAREKTLTVKKNALEAQRKLMQAAAKQKYDERIATFKARGREDLVTDAMIKHRIINRFKVSSFGIWNCDRPLPPYVYDMVGNFKDQHKNQYEGNTAYIVDKNRNTVVRFMTSDKTTIRFNQNSDNLMWFVTKDNRLAVFPPEEFKNMNQKKGKYTFDMDLKEQVVQSEEEIRKILHF